MFLRFKRSIVPWGQRAPRPPSNGPRVFRRTRVLIVGCGDVGLRAAQGLPHSRLIALTREPGRKEALRAAGIRPLLGDLDQPASLRRLAGLASRVLMLAPPPTDGTRDPRSRHLLQALARSGRPVHSVYVSTTGVYGDCQGAWIDECQPVRPESPRAVRRVEAERLWRRGLDGQASVLRVPGIYALDRAGGTPLMRLRRGEPVLRAEDDVWTNHIHADDLARACVLALWRGARQRVYNVVDDSQWRMGDYYAQAARAYGLPEPERLSRADLQSRVSPMQWSFMRESRRIRNRRLLQELRLSLRYPTVQEGLFNPITADPGSGKPIAPAPTRPWPL